MLRNLLVSLLLGTALLTPAAQPANEFWKDPQFVREFIGSFGINSGVEPRMTTGEQEFYKELASIISTNQTAAIDRLTVALNEKRTMVTPQPLPVLENERENEREKKSRKEKPPEPFEVAIENAASFWFVLGNLQVQEGLTEQAMASYLEAIKGFPDFLRAHKNIGVLYVQNQEFDKALTPLLKAIELGGAEGDLYGLLGACYLSTGQNRSAELAYNQAMVLSPGKRDWQLGAARALLYQGRYLEASVLFGELISKEPADMRFWLFQANCYIGLNEPLKAAYNYEVVRELGGADAVTLSALGDIYLSKDLKDLAVEAYLAALLADPERNRTRAIRSAEVLAARRAVEQSGRLVAAIQENAAASLVDEEKVKLLRLESKLALARGENESAARIMEELLDRNSMDGEIMLLLAGHYGKTGQIDRAEFLYERAERLPEFASDAHIKHAQLLVREKRYDRAIEHLKQALLLEPKESVQRYLDAVVKTQAATQLRRPGSGA